MSDLAEDDYVYTDLGIEKVHYCEVNGEKEMVTPKGFILGNVPDFKQFNWIKLDNIRVNMENAKVKQQLAIAVEALKYIYDDTKKGHTQCDACGYCSSCETCINAEWAEKALNQIKELEK